MKINTEDLKNWTDKRYYWHLGRFKMRVNYWLYARTPLEVFGRSWETTKYDRLFQK